MVGGAVTHPAATTEPDMKPFDKFNPSQKWRDDVKSLASPAAGGESMPVGLSGLGLRTD